MKWFLGVFLVSVFGLLWYIWWDDRNSPYDFIRYIGDWPVRFRSRYVHGQTLYEICQNKYKSYLFVQRLGIPVPRLYFYGFLDGLDVATLPECFVIKTLHGFGSKTVFPFIKGVNQFDPSVGMEKVLEKIGGRLRLAQEPPTTRGGGVF